MNLLAVSHPSSLLDIQNLTIRFLHKEHVINVLDQISFSLYRGQTLALVGESGSGKSLTALAIARLLPAAARVDPNSHIFLNTQSAGQMTREDLLSIAEINMRHLRGRRIGIIFQEAGLAFNPVLTIGKQIDEIQRRHFPWHANERRERMLYQLERVGIRQPLRCSQSYSHELSGGMRQRAMIAMALAGEPDLLIADEPTTALDVTLQAQIIELLHDIQQQTKMSLLFITHDLGIVYQLADDIVLISNGKVMERTGKQDFFKAPQTPYGRQLLSAFPRFTSRRPTLEIKAAQSEQFLLVVQDLKVNFPIRKGWLHRTVAHVKAVDGVNFGIPIGQTFALVGESGCGKTSIAKGILQIIKPTAGRIVFANQPLLQLPKQQWCGKLQMLFQDPYASMDPRQTVAEIISEGMLAQNKADNITDCYRVMDELLVKVGLSPQCKNRYPHEFSGGQRQRICIARALAMEPELIIFDEPTSALDELVQLDILKLLNALQQEMGLTYLLITHNFSVVAYLAHQVAVMRSGKIVEQGDVEQILWQPKHEYTRQLLAAVPQPID